MRKSTLVNSEQKPVSLAKDSNNIFNYFITIVTIFSVNPFFGTVQNFYLLIFFVVLLLRAIHTNVELINFRIALVLLLVYALIFIQGLVFGGFSYAALYVPIILFYVPFLIYKIMGYQFVSLFVKVMLWIVIFTTPLWLLQSFIPYFDSFFKTMIELVFPYSWGSVPRSLLLFTPMWADYGYNVNFGVYRNSGLFHEPGAYGVFLIFALGAQLLSNRGNLNITGKIFILALFTTFSTANYIALFVLLVIYSLSKIKDVLKKTIVVSLFLVVSVFIYETQDFLSEKITNQRQNEQLLADQSGGIYRGQSGRFFAFITAFDFFQQNPITGRGIIDATSEKATGEMHRESSYIYGPMGVLATYGVVFSFIYFFFLYKGLSFAGLKIQQSVLIIGIFLSFLIAVSSQVFVLTIFMIYFMILGLESHIDRLDKPSILR